MPLAGEVFNLCTGKTLVGAVVNLSRPNSLMSLTDLPANLEQGGAAMQPRCSGQGDAL